MEFTSDERALDIDEQFLWGSSLLISPALTPVNSTRAYFPPSADWYNYFTGEKTKYNFPTFPTSLNEINVHTRSGSIIPTQEPDVVKLVRSGILMLNIEINTLELLDNLEFKSCCVVFRPMPQNLITGSIVLGRWRTT